MSKARAAALFLTFCLAAPRAFALFQPRLGWTKVVAVTRDLVQTQDLASKVGGEALWQYQSQALLYVPDSSMAKLIQITDGLIEIRPRPDFDMIYDLSVVIDVRVGLPSQIPSSERFASYPSGTKGLYLLQYMGPIASEWYSAVDALGINQVQYLPYNTMIVAATPEQAMLAARFPFIQWLDFFHPFLKYLGPSPFPPGKIRWSFIIGVGNSGSLEAAVEEIRVLTSFVSPTGPINGNAVLDLRVSATAEQVILLKRHRLVMWGEVQGYASPQIYSAFPHHAPRGSPITVSGEGFRVGARAFVGDREATTTIIDGSRLRIVIPDEAANGPADILVRLASGENQVIEGSKASGLTIESPEERSTLAAGDLVVTERPYSLLGFDMIPNAIRSVSPKGQTNIWFRGPDVYTIFIDPNGFVNAVGSEVRKYDVRFMRASNGPAFLAGANRIVLDRDGNYLALFYDNRLVKFSSDGRNMGETVLPGYANALDLSSDQCTVVYPTGTGIARYDICLGRALAELLVKGGTFGGDIAIAPDGTYLTGVGHISATGEIISRLPFYQSAIGLSPDGWSALIAQGNQVSRYDLRTHSQVIVTQSIGKAASAVVYGGWTAARGTPGYGIDPTVSRVSQVDGPSGSIVIIEGAGFLPGVTVTIGGITVTVQLTGSTTIRFALPSTAAGQIVITNPNGQQVLAPSPIGVPTLSLFALLALCIVIAGLGLIVLRK